MFLAYALSTVPERRSGETRFQEGSGDYSSSSNKNPTIQTIPPAKSGSPRVHEESLLAAKELKLACTILKIAEELGEEQFYNAVRLAKFVVILALKFNLLPSYLVIINHFGPYPWGFNRILENAQHIKVINCYKEKKPYKYSLTPKGEKIADMTMLKMSYDKRKKVVKTIEDLIKRYPYDKYRWWHLKNKLITESYMIFADRKGRIRNLGKHKIVKLFKFNYQGSWMKYHSTLFHRFEALHADSSIKMYETQLRPMTPLIYEKYTEPFVWKWDKPLRNFLKNRQLHKRLFEDKIQTKNCILNKWEILEAIWFYQVLTGGFPSAKELSFLCLCVFPFKEKTEKVRKAQEKALRYSLNKLEEYGLIISFKSSRKRYSVTSRHFWDELEEECFSLPHPLDILENCQRTAYAIHNVKFSKIFTKGIQNFKRDCI